MTLTVASYSLYLAASLFVTTYVGHLLHRDGCPLCRDVFRDRPRMGDAVNDSLLVGYYLLNFALDVLLLSPGASIHTPMDALYWISGKLGIVLTTLGGMHFVNVVTLLVGFRLLRSLKWIGTERSLPGH